MFQNRDLAGAIVLVVLTLVWSVLLPSNAITLLFTLATLFILPGYVTTAIVYADHQSGRGESSRAVDRSLVAPIERVAFSLGLSLAVLPVILLVVYILPMALSGVSILVVVGGYVVIGSALVRRRRAHVPTRGSNGGGAIATLATYLRPSPTRSTRTVLLNGALVFSIVVATATFGVAMAAPSHGAATTDLHLLTESGDRYVADEYPSTLTGEEPAQVTAGVTNDEHQPVEYTLVAELQRVRIQGYSVVVTDSAGIGRYQFELKHGETRRQQLTVEPALTGENLRLSVYLYRGEAPESPTVNSAYRHTYLWVDSQPSGAGAS